MDEIETRLYEHECVDMPTPENGRKQKRRKLTSLPEKLEEHVFEIWRLSGKIPIEWYYNESIDVLTVSIFERGRGEGDRGRGEGETRKFFEIIDGKKLKIYVDIFTNVALNKIEKMGYKIEKLSNQDYLGSEAYRQKNRR